MDIRGSVGEFERSGGIERGLDRRRRRITNN